MSKTRYGAYVSGMVTLAFVVFFATEGLHPALRLLLTLAVLPVGIYCKGVLMKGDLLLKLTERAKQELERKSEAEPETLRSGQVQKTQEKE